MHPRDYFHDLIEPTLAEFEAEPTNIRRGYSACLFTYHFADAAAAHTGRKQFEIVKELAKIAPVYEVVQGIANMAKHIELTRGKVQPRIADTHTGSEAAFTDGTFWDDGTSWTDSEEVVRTRDSRGHPIDVRWCVREARQAIEVYLGRPDMQ
jgi:hypothetical protein